MSEPLAFISLARRLGNPIAERPEARAIVALSELAHDLRTVRRKNPLARATRDCVEWLRTVTIAQK